MGPMVSATLRVGRTRLTVRGDRPPAGPGSARLAKSRQWKERSSNQSRALISTTHPLLRARCFTPAWAEPDDTRWLGRPRRAGGFRDRGGPVGGQIQDPTLLATHCPQQTPYARHLTPPPHPPTATAPPLTPATPPTPPP